MKSELISFIAILFLAATSVHSQDTEFENYDNDLVYSPQTMLNLANVVDSLDLKFRSCDLNKQYYSMLQTIGHVVDVDLLKRNEAIRDMKANMDFESFRKKYPDVKVDQNVLFLFEKSLENKHSFVTAHVYEQYSYRSIRKSQDDFTEAELKHGRWLYDDSEGLRAFYFIEPPQSKPLKEKYNLMIHYADCMIDTCTTKIYDNADRGGFREFSSWQMFTVVEKEKMLEKMRQTRVVGFCSQDSSPRVHALNIAKLSAQLTNWEVFLRAHLDIMNDRFERVSDGSYAYGRRKTYLRELEELDINTLHLLLGITFRVSNAAEGHYYGSVARLARAISESSEREKFERELLSIVQDESLDYFNRIIAYFFLSNETHFLEGEEKLATEKLLAQAKMSLPTFLHGIIE